MNYSLPFIPKRPEKPREKGLTMVMDKGLSVNETKNLISSCGQLIDLVKFGFGTSMITNNLEEKIKLYKDAGIKPYFGGTLFEAFIVRGLLNEYIEYLKKYEIDLVEVSDGSILMEFDEKLRFIEKIAKQFTVISEIGSKQKGIVLPPDQWIRMMKEELNAGSWKVIAEARESGTVGIYNADGSANIQLINFISSQVNQDDIIWEAPDGKQQIFFIKTQGSNVNLGNIAPNLVIPLETLRLGLRGDTFLDYLPDDIKEKRAQVTYPTHIIDFQI
jgi:phosphosulfolactate synthase